MRVDALGLSLLMLATTGAAAARKNGFQLTRSPFVIRVGHGPCAMAIGPRFQGR